MKHWFAIRLDRRPCVSRHQLPPSVNCCSLSATVSSHPWRPPAMLRTLLTPLRLRFDSSPRSAVTANVTTPSIPDEEELDPEDFARDVLIELMRIAVDKLKLAETTHDRIEVCGYFPLGKDQRSKKYMPAAGRDTAHNDARHAGSDEGCVSRDGRLCGTHERGVDGARERGTGNGRGSVGDD